MHLATTGPRFCGSRFVAPSRPRRCAHRAHRARPASRRAARKLASRFFASRPSTRAPQVATQSLSTHQASVTYWYGIAPGCVVGPNNAGNSVTVAGTGVYVTNPDGTVTYSPSLAGDPVAGSQPTRIDPRAVTVQQAALRGLGLLNPSQVETSNVLPGDAYFAKVMDPKAIDMSTWTTTFSSHGPGRESPAIPGYTDYALKFYDDRSRGNVIAVIHPTWTFTHMLVDWPLYQFTNYPINYSIAQSFLNSKPPPPPPPQAPSPRG
jgi:hypothetical protein